MTRLPTLTPFPTYSTDYQNKYAFELLYNANGGCKLPCWWGITPGVTTWEETAQFINRFGGFTSSAQSLVADNMYIWYAYAPFVDYAPPVRFEVKGGLVESIDVPPEMVAHQFLLHAVLQKFGVPSEILIGPNPNHSNDSEFTSITAYILYKDLHIMDIIFLYGATRNDLTYGRVFDNYLSPCEPWESEELFLWAPDSDSYLDTLASPDIRPLDQVSSMTVKSFYDKYRQPLSWKQICIDLTDNAWK